ncbi:miniconductance mechanosensitive channel [Neisseria animalis]|uniref:Mechanosensing system component YbdG n=2 Tax=Neisseria animalis TaxID=492 RepID=A0A5P3MW63_NEIAN|nr:miniconductance mechanosensitive channel [Neisseria animalis]ROW31805.1 miniconductance mechanosensitive channel [Neisseria animalis]
MLTLTIAALIALTTAAVHILLHLVVFRIIGAKMQSSKILFLQVLAEKSLFKNLAFTIQGVLLSLQLSLWLEQGGVQEFLLTLTNIFTIIFGLLTLFALLGAVETYFFRRNIAQHFPMRGLMQTVKLIAAIGAGILIVSMLLNKSPLFLLSGLGAMTAVLMLVFKDPILGLVAGIQLSANKMLNIGDWLEMPKYNADGSVIDIGLTTVKVSNWDNTVTTIPTYALISDSFKNWQAMSESGGRRIKRPVYIDSTSVRFLSEADIEKLAQSRLLKEYLSERQQEIDAFNHEHAIGSDSPLNGRRLTNLGTFRAYLKHYLENHPRIRKDMTLLVRQTEGSGNGIPLEIYCFTNTVAWGEYEAIQSDIFDHIFAVIGEFGLRVFQNPTGHDFSMMAAGPERRQ